MNTTAARSGGGSVDWSVTPTPVCSRTKSGLQTAQEAARELPPPAPPIDQESFERAVLIGFTML